jgi:hypothetical protein
MKNNPNQNKEKKFIITKRIAKHGSQSIIVIPRILESHLKPGTVAEVTINVIQTEISPGGKDGSCN